MPFDVRMPDGTLIRNVPEGTTKEQVLAKYQASQGPAEPEEQFGFWESAARGIGEGVTLGTIDELYGGYKALTSDESYEEARDRFRAEQAAAREEDPWTFGLSEVAGGFALPGLGAAKAAGTATRALSRAARAAGIGAGYGAAAGAGYSEGETAGEVAGDVLRGATLGGALGAGAERVGRGLTRARQRYGAQGRAERAVADIIDPDQAKAALAENPNLVLGDLTAESRGVLAVAAGSDDAVFQQLQKRTRDIPDELMAKLPELDELAPAPVDAREATYSALSRPRAFLDSLFARFGDRPGFQKQFNEAVKTVERKGIKWVPGNSRAQRRYAMAVTDNLQSRLYKKAVPSGKKGMKVTGQEKESWASLRGELLDVVREANPTYVDEVSRFGTLSQSRRETQKLYDAVTGKFKQKGLATYLDDLADVGTKDRENLVALLGPQAADEFMEAGRVYRAMLETMKQAKSQRKVSDSVLREVDKNLNNVKKDVQNLFQSAAADNWLGVQQKLGTAAALRRLLRSVSSLVPFMNAVGGGGAVNERMIQMLLSRNVPQYQAAAARPLSRTLAAGIGGAAAATGG